MKSEKQFKVFGDPVEILVSGAKTNGAFTIMTQVSEPGGGPPPHVHALEDEVFFVLEGEYEMFDGENWKRIPAGECAYTLRGQPHTFRNCGLTRGKMMVIVTPAGLDTYLEKISLLAVPDDMEKLMEISEGYGIRFLTPAPVEAVPV